MDYMTCAFAFAQIVSLIAVFKGEKSPGGSTVHDFLTWLSENDQKGLKAKLETNTEALQGIQTLLNQSQELFSARLEGIDTLLAKIASRIDGFSALVETVRPNVELSEQAIGVLRQLDQSGARGFLEVVTCDSTDYILLGNVGGSIEYSEQRFIQDDLNTLVELGFLRQDYNSQGSPIYIFTRTGSRLVNLVDGQAT